jgi:chemotaxis protein methyltransferase WspC
MNLAPVVGLLERRIGLDPASLGPTVLPTAVGDRMRSLGLADPAAYAGRLQDTAEEFQTLAERLVVPETWFFRGAGLFDELARRAAAALQSSAPGRTFRALSLPCSTGEEPYSLAVALLDAGLDPDRWAIDGIDLSPRLIAAARRGVYREFSFRQTDAALRDRYFRPAADGWELAPAIRDRVRFRAGNLADPALLPDDSGAYDLVLCRNLLIYLTPAARRQALDTLGRLLAPGGLLGVGHAEPQMLAGRPFARVGPESCFLFRQESATTVDQPGQVKTCFSPPPPVRQGPAIGEGRVQSIQCSVPGSHSPSVPRPKELISAEPPLTRARSLADAGRLDEALAALPQAPPSADGYSLLGVIQQARGDRAAAAAAFRKALYLDPGHREALTHAMLLAAERGDAGQAAALRERLARIGPGGAS